jgi:Fe-S cluster assembly protein SufD
MKEILKFENEDGEFSAKRQKALELIPELEMPESIRTPGRTWTRYPEIRDEQLEGLKQIEPEIKTEGEVKAFTGEEAVEKAGDKLFDAIKTEEDKINAVHTAFMNSIVYLKVEGKAEISILYEEDSPVFSHLVVETGTNAEANITEEFQGNPEIQTSFNEFYLGDNSTVEYGAVESIESGFSYSRRKAVTGRDSKINWLNSQFGGDLNRTKIETVLKGDNSSTEKTGVWYPVDDQHIDISLHVRHVGDNTKCDMDSRAVVDNKSRSVYEGLQKVGDNAEDTQSFQDEKALMLSDKAEADASPKLMIENPDVEASHAASAGNVPKDELHYMESRGISEEAAQKLVVKGFFEPVMEQIELPDLKQKIRQEVQEKLDRSN